MNVFLFGAGASYGSVDCRPHLPPLGTQLFDVLEGLGGTTSSLSEDQKFAFKQKFEPAMADLYATSSRKAYALLREMGSYFSEFKPGNKNLYIDLISHLLVSGARFTLATTNYDLLIEQSIQAVGSTYDHEPGRTTGAVMLYKIHGSCNFLPVMRGISMKGCTFTGPGAAMEVAIRVAWPNEVRAFCQQQDSVAPSIAMYTTGKEVKICPQFVLNQLLLWQSLSSGAARNFVIGLKVEPVDSHIWDVLAQSPGDLIYVGLERDLDEWKDSVGKRNAYWVGARFDEALPLIKAKLL